MCGSHFKSEETHFQVWQRITRLSEKQEDRKRVNLTWGGYLDLDSCREQLVSCFLMNRTRTKLTHTQMEDCDYKSVRRHASRGCSRLICTDDLRINKRIPVLAVTSSSLYFGFILVFCWTKHSHHITGVTNRIQDQEDL